MKDQPTIFIAGSGGIGRAVALLLREIHAEETSGCRIILGDRSREQTEEARRWILDGSRCDGDVKVVVMPEDLPTDGMASEELERSYREADIILDCLPGSLAVRLCDAALRYDSHYANVTEYVDQTREICKKARHAETGFLLQTGLAPGYINILGIKLLDTLCTHHDVDQIERLILRVGALTQHAEPPHYYGFTWSPVGVATEYIMPATTLRCGRKTELKALTEREPVVIGGITYEEALTSGGVANLCDFLKGKVVHLDYKTLRYPGHFAWIESKLESCPPGIDRTEFLQKAMEQVIAHYSDDVVVIYASVSGKDGKGILRRMTAAKMIRPVKFGLRTLKAIQVTTAAALAESARLLLTDRHRGVVQQSDIPMDSFLKGPFVSRAYGDAADATFDSEEIQEITP